MARRYCGGRHSAGSVARTACSALSSRQGWHDSGIFRILPLQRPVTGLRECCSNMCHVWRGFPSRLAAPCWLLAVALPLYDPCSIPKKKVLR